MSVELEEIQESLSPLKDKIVQHQVYKVITSVEDLKIFMRYHVYAVWDFMSLLKALQINLTCTTLPWFPVGSGSTRALINEIVAGEESDIDAAGNKKSHFEMYLDAMEQCGADTNEIRNFIAALQSGQTLEHAYLSAGTPEEAREFVNFTFSIINSGKSYNQAAAFTFGREDLIPSMFHAIVTDLNEKFPDQISLFKYYLDRHIEVDGDHHSHLALNMTEELCNQNSRYWQEAEICSKESLNQRIKLWDGVYKEIITKDLVSS
ncbi:MAG TPA: DUF3050 domain-containing protein [Pedobacter sp.]|uniref:DUF3050 domain-containing protein n=1 Tax=Pedobacter sp. TaxID=1411316 RepID=UPI002B956D2D|nr:DUF3050 domain-containing protein [Pedobacter sp.]HMI05843.1 DUF3050 domain-containing protein [Pedobacter sp.]